MSKMSGQERSFFALCVAIACVLSAAWPSAFALDPKLDVGQYAHTEWKVRDGFFKSGIYPIAQTRDGYLWLGSESGLLRFDGVRTVLWQPGGDQHLESSFIFSLLASQDGTLWIGTLKELASWKDGKLTHYPELDGHYIYKILEDHEGTVWISGVAVPNGKLCAIRKGNIQCSGDGGTLGRGAMNLYEDSKGNLWAGVVDGVWRWRPGPPKFYSLGKRQPDGIQALGEDTDGTLLIGWNGGLQRFVDGNTQPYPLPGFLRKFRARRILRDRDGSLWIGTSTDGLLHLHQGRTDQFSLSDGLSAEDVGALFEDGEGNIWVTTNNGLDRFRDYAIPTFSVKQGLLNTIVGSVLADRDGRSVWLATYGGLNQWDKGQITIPQTGSVKQDGKLNGQAPNSLFQDDRGKIWISTFNGIGYLDNRRFALISALSGGPVLSFAQDHNGSLWVSDEALGLFHLSHDAVVQQIPWSILGNQAHATDLAVDPVRGGLWLGFHLGGVAYFRDGKIQSFYSTSSGLGEGRVNRLRLDKDGTLWASTEGGLSRLKDGLVSTLTSKNGLPCDGTNWTMEDDDQSFWLYMDCGLVRIKRSELDAWATDPDRKIQVTVFDSADGVRSFLAGGHFNPQVAKTRDGKLWFLPSDGVSVIDPHHLALNKIPPPVYIEQIAADHRNYDTISGNGNIRLPSEIRDLQIDYTALSLVVPEKVLFRYKLEGWDRDWQDAGTRRQAFYSNLPPGDYRFRVIACNNSGVWNEAGAFLNFSVAPAYYQTIWFRALSVIAFLGLAVALYESRLRQVAHQFNIRMEERVNERTRVARDLHDTLLQSFQGLLLKFHAITYLLPDRPNEAQKNLEIVIDQAREAITEGRDAVHGLRASGVGTSDLAQTITALGNDLAAAQPEQNQPEFGVQVEGSSRDLAPLLCDEVYRLTAEALRNAFKHASASRIEVEIRYDRRQFRLRVRDNGKGIEKNVVGGDGRIGHFGLPGMHERAKLAGGKLSVWSEVDSGTEVELTIPAGVAYAKSPTARRPMFFRRGA